MYLILFKLQVGVNFNLKVKSKNQNRLILYIYISFSQSIIRIQKKIDGNEIEMVHAEVRIEVACVNLDAKACKDSPKKLG